MKTFVMLFSLLLISSYSHAEPPKPPKPEFPNKDEVLKDYELVVSSMDKSPSLLQLYVNRKENQILAALPKKFDQKKFYIATTMASGEALAGLQAGEKYVYFKRIGKRIMVLQPNLNVRPNQESKSSVKRLYTDRLLIDIPIVTMLDKDRPIIDLDDLFISHASKFFGSKIGKLNANLAQITTSKAFPSNIELGITLPVHQGILKTLHYSVSEITPNKAYKPRVADQRVGYFTTSFQEIGQYTDKDTKKRFINRWHLEKADPKLEVSPVKKPIIFYIEHTTPVRYRRWVREGILMWNKAFEKIGLANAIEVYYQDAATGAHMDKDPEDVRYNFVRWLSNDIGIAIGPSRVNPETGEILDADIIFSDGWIRHYLNQFNDILPAIAMEGFNPDTLDWLKNNPHWDPRLLLSPPSMRQQVKKELDESTPLAFGGHPISNVDSKFIGDQEYDGLYNRVSQVNGFCRAADCKAMDLASMRMHFDFLKTDSKDDTNNSDNTQSSDPKKPMIDGVPEEFIGPLVAEVIAHEVGHTLGLRHNFKASSLYTIKEINSKTFKEEQKAFASSVMDYLPMNINVDTGEVQGDYMLTDIGPYDFWAIEFGYHTSNDPKELDKVLQKVSDPLLQFATDEDTIGPDPYARRYDFSKEPLDYAKEQMKIVQNHRSKLIDQFVKKGESWSRAREGYNLTLYMQYRSISMMSNWLGGSHINRDKKGDPGDREPITPVSSQKQREALEFVLEHTFKDEAYHLTPKLLKHMTSSKWIDNYYRIFSEGQTWPIHQKIMNLQASALTMLLNPTTLSRIYDNEFLIEKEADRFALSELLNTINDSIWKELEKPAKGQYNANQPLISSLRRNLQRLYLERLIELSFPKSWYGASSRPLANLAKMHLKNLVVKIEKVEKQNGLKLDDYTASHLLEAKDLIQKALDAKIIYGSRL